MRLYTLAVALSSGAFTSTTAWGDSFQVSSWSLETAIVDGTTGFGAFSDAVQNPYMDEHHVSLASNPLSDAHSYFDFSWSPDTASFLIQSSHTAFDGNGGTRSVSAGNIYITPSIDLLVTATGSYAYDMPAWDMDVAYAFVVYDSAFQERFVQSFGDSTFKGPTSGIFSLSGTDILPAGETSIIRYIMYIDGFGSSGLLASGSGEIHFSLAAVPECSTLALLAFGMACLRKPRRRLRLEA